MKTDSPGKKETWTTRQNYHIDWKEPKLFTLHAIDETGHKPNKQLLPCCDGTITGRDPFKQLFKMYFYKTYVVATSQIIKKNIAIDSSAIESVVRRIVKLRLEGAGMFWLKHNAEAFLHLKCQLKSKRWDEFFLKRINPV